MSLYANGLNIQMNELALLQFKENSQTGETALVSLAIQYDVLKQMHQAIGSCLEQYEAKLHQLQRDKAKAN